MILDRRRFTCASTMLGVATLLPATARAATALRIGYAPVIGAAALLVFARSGMARGAGLDLTLVKLDRAKPTLPNDDDLDGAAIGVAPLARARAAGGDLAIVCGLATAGAGFVAVPDLARRFDVARGDPAKAFAAFKTNMGRRAKLATSPRGLLPNVLLHHWLFAIHTVPNDLVEIDAMDLPGLHDAIVTKTVDGATLPEPVSTIARAHDPSLQRIISGAAMFPDAPGIVLGVSASFSQDHPDACRALVKGIVAATQLVREMPADAAPLAAEALDVAPADRALVTRALTSSNIGFVTDPRAIGEPAKRLLAYEEMLGDFFETPPVDGLIDTSFYPATR